MFTLAPELQTKCRDVFSKCNYFDNYAHLRTIFDTTELAELRPYLPTGSNPSELAELCTSFLLHSCKIPNKLFLPLFIKILRDKYPDQGHYPILDDLYNEVSNHLLKQIKGKVNTNEFNELFTRLLLIDYGVQVNTIQKQIEKNKITSFLIQGKPDFGQKILLHRVLTDVLKSSRKIVKKFPLGTNGIGSTSFNLWEEIERQVMLGEESESHDHRGEERKNHDHLIERICDWLNTQDVYLIFDTIDYTTSEIYSELLNNFWGKLVKKIYDKSSSNQKLILLLVDYKGIVGTWNLKVDCNEFPYSPHPLPLIEVFGMNLLEYWVTQTAAGLLPPDLSAEYIFQESNGIPMQVFKTICKYCNYSWNEVELCLNRRP